MAEEPRYEVTVYPRKQGQTKPSTTLHNVSKDRSLAGKARKRARRQEKNA